MRIVCVTVVFCLFVGVAAFADPPLPVSTETLTPGAEVVLRVRQVIPSDGLSRGERMLNGLEPIKAGDLFTAELPAPPGQPALILIGCVEEVIPPRRFGRPGKVSVKLAWSFDPAGGERCNFDVEDQRFSSAQKRRAITTLFMVEGFAMGASVGSNLDGGRSAATLGGGGVGLLLGIAYASLQPGQAASLEPGDTLAVMVGTTDVKKLPPESPLKVFPAHEPEVEKHARKRHARRES